MNKLFKNGILVGRFQTLHLGHGQIIEKALDLCENVTVFIGSSQESRTQKNPFGFDERKKYLQAVYGDKIAVYPLPDIGVGNNPEWGEYVIKNALDRTGSMPDLFVSGKEERRASWLCGCCGNGINEMYLAKSIDIDSTRVRKYLLENDLESWKKCVDGKLWRYYEEMRCVVLKSQHDPTTQSI